MKIFYWRASDFFSDLPEIGLSCMMLGARHQRSLEFVFVPLKKAQLVDDRMMF